MGDKKIGILIFDHMAALDVVGPYEVLSKLPNTKIFFISVDRDSIETTGGLKLIADSSIESDVIYDVLLIPGGSGIKKLIENEKVIQ